MQRSSELSPLSSIKPNARKAFPFNAFREGRYVSDCQTMFRGDLVTAKRFEGYRTRTPTGIPPPYSQELAHRIWAKATEGASVKVRLLGYDDEREIVVCDIAGHRKGLDPHAVKAVLSLTGADEFWSRDVTYPVVFGRGGTPVAIIATFPCESEELNVR